jgi:hypothetical protein
LLAGLLVVLLLLIDKNQISSNVVNLFFMDKMLRLETGVPAR